MTEAIQKKINNIERMLIEINSKINNFLGMEELTEEEWAKLRKIRKEIKKGILGTMM
ncbi:hypothetical protein BMS3Bbin15_01188 [archaeon BMS3Bbin15]|nr:hypothetical protein BMS3Bbin15_01188 [archaeon BMS3Bbin15]